MIGFNKRTVDTVVTLARRRVRWLFQPPRVGGSMLSMFPGGLRVAEEEEEAAVADSSGPPAVQGGAAAAKTAAASERESAPQSLRARAAPAPSSSVELRRDRQLAPEAWLGQVRDLLRQGRRQQAQESLRLFHRTHPRHPVPDDLRRLLE